MSSPTTVVSTSRRGRPRAPDLTPAQAQRFPSPPHYMNLPADPTWVHQLNGQWVPPAGAVMMRRYLDALLLAPD